MSICPRSTSATPKAAPRLDVVRDHQPKKIRPSERPCTGGAFTSLGTCTSRAVTQSPLSMTVAPEDDAGVASKHASIHLSLSGADATWNLLPVFRIGRGSDSHLRLPSSRVSHSHCELRHAGNGAWVVRDLGSKNGTSVNGRRLPAGLDTALANGDVIEVGSGDCRVIFAPGQPADALLTKPSDAFWMGAAAGERWLEIASTDSSTLTLVRHESDWYLESATQVNVSSPLVDGQVLVFAGEQYRLWLGDESGPTEDVSAERTRLSEAVLRVAVSQDEEEVHAELELGGNRFSLPTRVYLYMVLLLARYRRQDSVSGLDAREAGWRYADEVAEALAVDAPTLNVHVFRIRRDLAKLGFCDPHDLIERRTLAKQLRLGIPPERCVLNAL